MNLRDSPPSTNRLPNLKELTTSAAMGSEIVSLERQSELFAESAGLRYVHDRDPGFQRRRKGKGFIYLDHEKFRITHDGTLARIRSLVIPPAWEDVWICRHKNGHLQATGRDLRERKQYRYHPVWCRGRNETKFQKLLMFGEALPHIREQIKNDLSRPGLGRKKVLAAVLQTMAETMIRIGNDEYAEENDSYGLTTIRNDQTTVRGSEIRFRFRGKSGVEADIRLHDRRLSKIIHLCQEIPGQKLFSYESKDGSTHEIESGDVNGYLKEVSNEPITAKFFRTWGATVRAAETLYQLGTPEKTTEREFKRRQNLAVEAAASYLGNTVAVSRKYYVHPVIFEADKSGLLRKCFDKKRRKQAPVTKTGLSASELVIMEILEQNPT